MLKLQAFFASLSLFTQGVLEKLKTVPTVTKTEQATGKNTYNFSSLSPEELYDEVKTLSTEFNTNFGLPDFEEFKAKNKNKAQALYDAVQKLTSSQISDKKKVNILTKLAEAFDVSTQAPVQLTMQTPQDFKDRLEKLQEKDNGGFYLPLDNKRQAEELLARLTEVQKTASPEDNKELKKTASILKKRISNARNAQA